MQNGRPALTLLTYYTEASEASGGRDGGMLSAMVSWGITQQEQQQLQAELRRRVPGGVLNGAAEIRVDDEDPSFYVVAGAYEEEGTKFAYSGRAPVQPSGRAALSAKLDSDAATILKSALEEANVGGIFAVIDYHYLVRAHAINCQVTIDWNQVRTQFLEYSDSYRKSGGGCCFKKTRHFFEKSEVGSDTSWAESAYRSQCTPGEGSTPELEERTDQILAEMTQSRLERILDAGFAENDDGGDEDPSEGRSAEQMDNGMTVTINRQIEQSNGGHQSFEIDRSVVLRRPMAAEGDIKEWVDELGDQEGVIVSDINLSNSEFRRYPITVNLDETAVSMMGNGLQRVNVMIRKKRESGSDYTDSHAFTPASVSGGEIVKMFEYAKGTDPDPTSFEVATEWYFSNGKYPSGRPTFEQQTVGSGGNLSPPVMKVPVEFFIDPGDLQYNDVTRATAEVKYVMLGRERTSSMNVRPTTDGQVNKDIFVDADSDRLAYRVVFHHKRHGQLATEWRPDTPNRDVLYVDAVVPEEMLSEDASYIEQAKAAVVAEKNKPLDSIYSEFDNL